MKRSPHAASRYDGLAVALHWIVAAVVLVQYPLGWWMQTIAMQPPGPRAEVFNLHKSIGLTILAVMIVRVGWRLRHAPPALPAMARWQAWAAHSTHVLLYAILIGLPLAGYLGSAFSGYPVRFFGFTLPSWAPKNAHVKDFMSTTHLALSWALLTAFALHLAGVAKHLLLNHDGLLRRMSWSRPQASAR
jgi:cytochrome b561